MKKFESSKPFFRGEEMEWEIVDNGIKRKIMGYDDKIMLVHVLFEKGAIGSTHEHYHSQVSYVGSGVFDITIDGVTQKLKKGDSVIIISGKDKGKKGEILKVIEPDKLVISNVNLAKKHVKPNPNKGDTGGIIEREMPIHISNVMMLNPISKKGDRVGFKNLEDGKKVRVYKSNKEVIDI